MIAKGKFVAIIISSISITHVEGIGWGGFTPVHISESQIQPWDLETGVLGTQHTFYLLGRLPSVRTRGSEAVLALCLSVLIATACNMLQIKLH